MSKIALSGPASGTATYTISAPTGATDRTITLPDVTGTLVTSTSGSVSQAMLTSGVAGNGPAFSAYLGSAQTPTSSAFTKVLFDTELWDTNSNFSSSRFTPTVAGYYQVNSAVNYGNNTSACLLSIFKNGTEYKRGLQVTIASSYSTATSVSGIVYCNGSTDYVEIYIYQNNATALNAGQAISYFDAAMIRSA